MRSDKSPSREAVQSAHKLILRKDVVIDVIDEGQGGSCKAGCVQLQNAFGHLIRGADQGEATMTQREEVLDLRQQVMREAVGMGELQAHTFTPLWISFILVVNAVLHRRTGRSRQGALSKSHTQRVCMLYQPLPRMTPRVFDPFLSWRVTSWVT